MRKFTDTFGREWELDVNVGSIKRVRLATGIVLPALFDNKLEGFAELSTDYEQLVNVVWALCHKQRPEIDGEGFAEGMGGDSLFTATEALARAIADFFTSPELRKSYHKLVDLIFEASGKMQDLQANRMDTAMGTIDTSQMAASCLDSVTNGQA